MYYGRIYEVAVSLLKGDTDDDAESYCYDGQESAEFFVPSLKHTKVECGDFKLEEAAEDATEVCTTTKLVYLRE